MKSIFFQLIEKQTEILMLTEISEEYILKTVSKAMIAEEKISPNRSLIVAIPTLAGFTISLGVAIAVGNRRKTDV